MRVSWRLPEGGDDDRHSAGELRRIFERFGAVEDVVRRVKKGKGSAVVQMASRAAAVSAARRTLALGDALDGPLRVGLLVPEEGDLGAGGAAPAGAGAGIGAVMNNGDFENVVMAKLKRAAERRRMAAAEEGAGG